MATFRTKPPKGSIVQRAHPLARGLVAAWLLNEGAGPLVADSAGKSTGALVSPGANLTRVATEYGGGLKSAGVTGNRVDAQADPRPTSITLAVTVKWATAATVQIVVSNRTGGTEANGATMFANSSSINFWATTTATGSTWEIQRSGFTIVPGVWYRAVGTYDEKTGASALYVNGNLVTSGSISPAPIAWRTPTGRAWHLCSDDSNSPLTSGGLLAAAAIWNRALNAAEVRRDAVDHYAPFRRRPVPVPLAPIAAPTFQPAWARGCNQLVGPGALSC